MKRDVWAQDDDNAARRKNREAGSFMNPDTVPESWHFHFGITGRAYFTLSIRVLAGSDDAMIGVSQRIDD